MTSTAFHHSPAFPDGYVRLVETVLSGIPDPYGRQVWMRRTLPRTYARLGLERRWVELSDLPADGRGGDYRLAAAR